MMILGLLAFALVTIWIGSRCVRSSTPIQDAQRELDRKRRR
jgi:hypothetical protein